MGKRMGMETPSPPERLFAQPGRGWRPIVGVAIGFALALAAAIVFLVVIR
jgi:hypothetical protein